jgi:hypothetical protein
MNTNFIKRAFEKRTIIPVIICGVIFSMVFWGIGLLVAAYKYSMTL